MADKKPTDLIKIFHADKFELEEEVNEWLEQNPEFYLDQMEFVKEESPSRYVTLVCDFCLRKDLEDQEPEKDTALTEELLKGLIGAVNELTDTVKELTNKKESI
jgi:hypothetical protein